MSRTKLLNKLLPPIIISLVIVSLISIVMFWFILRGTLYAAAEEDFFEHAEIYSVIIEEHISKLESTAFQLGSRTQIRNKLDAYQQSEVTLDDAVSFIKPRLSDGIDASPDASGSIWLDIHGNVIVAVGSVEEELDTNEIMTELNQNPIHYQGPVILDGKTLIRLSTHIKSTDDTLIGYNIAYFPMANLEQIIERKMDMSVNMKLVNSHDPYAVILRFNDDYQENYHVQKRIRETNLESIPLEGLYLEHNSFAISLVPIPGTPWYLESSQSFADLHASITRLLYLALVLILVMVVVSITSSWRIIQTSMTEVEHYQNELMKSNDSLTESLKELKKTQDQLVRRETLAALGELVGGLMHELSTPIGTAITSLTYLDSEVKDLTDEEDDISHYQEAYNITRTNLDKAVSNIETFRVLNMDQATLEMRRIKIKNYIDEIVLSLKPKFKRTQHRIEIDCDPEMFIVTTPGLLSQILTNLITNSLRHGFEDIVSGLIKISVKREGNNLHIKYTDNGVGIPPHHIDHVFEPYFTTKRHEGGTGLGLHIIYSLVTTQLGGTVEIDSRLGHGTTFDIQFPVG